MITLRRSGERHHERRRKQESWLTFDTEDRTDPLVGGIGPLQKLNEDRFPPGASAVRQVHHDVEIVTYVRLGSVVHEDSMGRPSLVQAGEFQRVTSERGTSHRETNASRVDEAHTFQVWLRPELGAEVGREQKRFSAAERRGGPRVVASPDARQDSLRVHQQALIYSAILYAGQHMVHELAGGRASWVHLVQGTATLGDELLSTGDGAAMRSERAVSLTAREDCEVLIVEFEED